jgi:hypothetical protein
MPVESATYISDLNTAYPQAGESMQLQDEGGLTANW